MAKMFRTGKFAGTNGIGWNSVTFKDGDLVSKVGGFIVQSTAGVAIEWMKLGEQTFSANNQTVAKATAEYAKADEYTQYEMVINGGTITQADEWKFYNINSSQEVDLTTENALKSNMQLKLEKFISATKGIFSVVK